MGSADEGSNKAAAIDESADLDKKRASRELSALLLLISETNYETFSLMEETSQRAILSLAYRLSLG